MALAQSYILKNIYGKPHHRYSLDAYMGKVKGIYQSALECLSLNDFFVIFSLIMILAVFLICIYIFKNPGQGKKAQGIDFLSHIYRFVCLQPLRSQVLLII